MSEAAGKRLIETDGFPFEFLSVLAERESWRKEIHRPIYHVHKWWAKRLGSVFRGLALGSALSEDSDLATEFYQIQDFSGLVVFDPFMGSGTTLGEAHKLGLTALGRDINPVAVDAVRVAFGSLDKVNFKGTMNELADTVGDRIRRLYRTKDSRGLPAEVLYYFWVMQAICPDCREEVDLFSSWVRARNAYPRRKPGVQVVCPGCGAWFPGLYTDRDTTCPFCAHSFDQTRGTTRGSKATCRSCEHTFQVRNAATVDGARPQYRLYGKLVLTQEGKKEYLPTTSADVEDYRACQTELQREMRRENFRLPSLALADGHNTRQAISYGFREWKDFFNSRQLLALGWLREAISALPDAKGRDGLLTLFSGALEFNNMFASYKGEGTGAVRHMFSHHILKPERTPIEANLWGTPKSSGSFSGLFRGRLLRAIECLRAPTEVSTPSSGKGAVVCSRSFDGKLEAWRTDGHYEPRTLYLSCGDSATTNLAPGSIDLVLTDPPFFDNVHYSELADFFYAWQQLSTRGFIAGAASTRTRGEVQDTKAECFAGKLQAVFCECHRILKEDGLLVFTYHHSRSAGWTAVAESLLGSGFAVVNAHPIKAEMSVATPKAKAREPIQLDIAIVCRKSVSKERVTRESATASALAKLSRLEAAGFDLSRNDQRVVLFGQLLTTIRSYADLEGLGQAVEGAQAQLDNDKLESPSASQASRGEEGPAKGRVQLSMFGLDA